MKRVGVFIDGSNLFWASRKNGWKIDYWALKRFLNQTYSPEYYGYYSVRDESPNSALQIRRAKAQKKFLAKLTRMGYIVVTKPLKYIKDDSGGIVTKGDMDVELPLDIMTMARDLDSIVLFSGDSDYFMPMRSLHATSKIIHIYSFKSSLAWELKVFTANRSGVQHFYLDEIRHEIELTR
jgi:uncharacterized LabA/DUF88 family protein